jgi:hypothetical protein
MLRCVGHEPVECGTTSLGTRKPGVNVLPGALPPTARNEFPKLSKLHLATLVGRADTCVKSAFHLQLAYTFCVQLSIATSHFMHSHLPSIWEVPIATSQGVDYSVMPKRTVPTKSPSEAPEPRYKTSGINLPFDVWELLNRVAFERAKQRGGRPSVSGLLVDLVQRHRKELEKELTG